MVRAALDTNVLLRYYWPHDPAHEAVYQAVGRRLDEGWVLCYLPQTLREAYATLTRPVQANGLGASIEQARRMMRLITDGPFELLPDSADTHAAWLRTVATVEVRGRQTYDVALASALLAHGVDRLLTRDPGDFARYPGLNVENLGVE